MLIKKSLSWSLPENEATPESVYHQRRGILKKLGITLVGMPFVSQANAGLFDAFTGSKKQPAPDRRRPLSSKPSRYSDARLALTPENKVLKYNNFYEFGTDKYSPAKRAHTLRTSPWSVAVSGHCEKPGTLNLEDILKPHPLEERIYRLRCVEGWSMWFRGWDFHWRTYSNVLIPRRKRSMSNS